ncbi:hypothetical protein Trydic_g3862 [Trypoxylus dichotomus]
MRKQKNNFIVFTVRLITFSLLAVCVPVFGRIYVVVLTCLSYNICSFPFFYYRTKMCSYGNREKRTNPHICAVQNCYINSLNNEGYSMFGFPKDEQRIIVWINNSGREDLLVKDLTKVSKNTFICGKHFEDKMFANYLRNRLKRDAVPTLFMTPIRETNTFSPI